LELAPLLGGPTGYLLGERLAVGGMGSVYMGLKTGALGFQRVVAIKRLHAHLVHAAESVTRFKDEIRLVSRLSHPNLVQTFDVLESEGELVLVMEYVDGETLHALLQDARAAGVRLPVGVVAAILSQALHGLHAAHEATDEEGHSLNLVHRDVSPQNIMVDKDGVVKVLDFGVAKASSESHVTRTGEVSGKVAYMSPEQAMARPLDRRSDVFAAGIVLWEALTGERLFRPQGASESAALLNVLDMRIPPPSEVGAGVNPTLDRIVLRALDRDPGRRFGSARDFALALEDAFPNVSASAIANALGSICGARVLRRAERLRAFHAALRRSSELTEQHSSSQALARFVPDLREAGSSSDWACPSAPEHVSVHVSHWHGEAELHTRDLQGVLVVKGVPLRSRSLGMWLALGLAAATVAWFGGRVALDSPAAKTPSPSSRTSPASSAMQPEPAGPQQPAIEPVRAAVTAKPREAIHPDSLPPPPPSLAARGGKPSRAKRVPRPSSSRGTPPAESSACSPPSYTDAEGIRHFKPECL
jgi:serine/threonine-protein kinase